MLYGCFRPEADIASAQEAELTDWPEQWPDTSRAACQRNV
jgi:hypothetical protein